MKYLENCLNDTCIPNGSLTKGKYLQSRNGKYQLRFLEGIGVGLFCGSNYIWSTYTWIDDGYTIYFEKDGTALIVKDKKGYDLWRTDIEGKAMLMILQDDGNLVIYNRCNQSIFDTKTAGVCPKRMIHYFIARFRAYFNQLLHGAPIRNVLLDK